MTVNPYSAKCYKTLDCYAVRARRVEDFVEDYIGIVRKDGRTWTAHHRDETDPVGWFPTRAAAVDYLVRTTNRAAV